MIIKSNSGHVDTERIVLFPFDDIRPEDPRLYAIYVAPAA